MIDIMESIQRIFRNDIGGRGLGKAALKDDFLRAVEELSGSSCVFIVTGFCIRSAMIGETDGPIGTASLAYALEKIGKQVVIITDEYSYALLDCCIKILDLEAELKMVSAESSRDNCIKLVEEYRPSHIVALERPGKALDGRCYSMRGEDISDIVADTDALFDAAHVIAAKTISVGDGGNELGMGKISDYIKCEIANGELICACLSADYLIPAGISNWGGHGLAAALSIYNHQMLMYDANTEYVLLKAIVDIGAVDGCSKRNEMSVDGISLEANLEIFHQLKGIALNYLEGGESCD